MQAGRSSIQFEHPPIITSAASIVGQTEGEGPLASFFDRVEPDPMFGKKSWEEAESELQRQTVQKCLDKAGRQAADVNCLFAGDLLGRLWRPRFGVESFDIPFFGLYGSVLNDGGGDDPGGDGSRGWLCGPGSGAGIEPFCLGRTAVPVSAGVWESETAVHNLDGDGCGCVMIEKNEGKDGRRAKENASESLKNAGQENCIPNFNLVSQLPPPERSSICRCAIP